MQKTLYAFGLAVLLCCSAHAQAPARGAALAPSPSPTCGPNVPMRNVAADSRCFELRTYTVSTTAGSSNDVLHARFRDHTNRLFKKHGMTIVGFWQPVSRPDQLIYILAYKNAAARDASWAAFQADPEWVKV